MIYTSHLNSDGGVGAGWSNLWTARLNAEPPAVSPYVFAYRPSGQLISFAYETDSYASHPRTAEALEVLSDADGTVTGWRLSLPDGVSESYGRDGRLLSVSYPSGNEYTVTRDADGRILEVSDTLGQRLAFVYEGLHIASITDASGRTSRMQYSAEDDLITVTAPDNTQRNFHYNEQAHTSETDLPHTLTGVTDEFGGRVVTYEYYSDGRARRSFKAGGVNSRTIIYDDVQGTRTITTGNGSSTTYHTAIQNGVRVLTNVQGTCCSP